MLARHASVIGMSMFVAAGGAFAAEPFPFVNATSLHTFSFLNPRNGDEPAGGVIIAADGSLFGTAAGGGNQNCEAGEGCGVVFQLGPNGRGVPKTFQLIHVFAGKNDGAFPQSHLIQDEDGDLYGTTLLGGNMSCTYGGDGCGVVFEEIAPGSEKKWRHKVLHVFGGGTKDGADPEGGLTREPGTGTIYGTTCAGGAKLGGTVFGLAPAPPGAGTGASPFKYAILFNFAGGNDGGCPAGTLALDDSGNLYGTTVAGGKFGFGTVFRLEKTPAGWSETVLHDFSLADGDGAAPEGGVFFDQAGNLLGTTVSGGSSGGGIVFMLSPSGSIWVETVLHSFTAGADGFEPGPALSQDKKGNFFGVTLDGGAALDGTLFELVKSHGGYTFRTIYPFCTTSPTCADGAVPSSVTADPKGNLFGTTLFGGAQEVGNVFSLPAGAYP